MQNRWYGDDRDVVKWSTIVYLAQRESIREVLYVAMYRPDPPPPSMATARGPVVLPGKVLHHFRSLDDLQRLATDVGMGIDTITERFAHRPAYFGRVCDRVRAYKGPVVVFLDPDVGVVPTQPGPEHVTSADVSMVYDAMRPDDVLVCYQHARRQKDWRGRSRRAFANAPGVPPFDVETVRSELASDVLLLAVKKVVPTVG